jgi:dTDP-4-dehydrorhamnose reductase
MVKVAVLGSSGMLGSAITKYFESCEISVHEFNRSGVAISSKNECSVFDVTEIDSSIAILKEIEVDYIINCIGMVKHLINDNDERSKNLAFKVNSDFPLALNEYVKQQNIKTIQIGTDCVYSGKNGNYSEDSLHDPIDVYGVTKNIGELAGTSTMILRCSIIGKEIESSNSLLSWVLSQQLNSQINGFTNHFWNGVSTLHFAQIVFGIIKSESYENGVIHVVPSDFVTKYELIKAIATAFGRSDLRINKFKASPSINRVLTTNNPQRNRSLWLAGGYNEIPSVRQMISEFAVWTRH